MSWTKQQENAINARNSSVIVSAAAGSGKTAVLTERLARLLSDPCSGVRADRIAVVTFTNDAASEMKKRLEKNLRLLIEKNPSDNYLIKQQALLQNSKIATINSFCFDILRDNITNQGITSGFTVLDGADEQAIKKQAMEELFSYYTGENYEKISFLYDKFCMRDERPLTEIISRTDNFLSSTALRNKWLDEAVNGYSTDFRDSPYFSDFMAQCCGKLRKAYVLATEALDLMPRIFPDLENVAAAAKSLAQAQDEQEQVFTFMRIYENGQLPTKEQAEVAVDFGRKVTVTKKIECDHGLLEIYARKRKNFIAVVKEIAGSAVSAESDYNESRRVTELLAEAVRKYQEIIWQKKCEKNAISFDDGERLTLELLADFDENGHLIQSEAAKSLSESFDIIMIDEYQDSNNKQDMIFKLLSHNYKLDENGDPMYGDNVFLVGDVKQSIYGFRLANPKNFIRTLESSEPYDPESSSPNKSIYLNKNFRSSPEVTDFVNFIFGNIMSRDCGDIDYTDNEKLYFGAEAYTYPHKDSRKTLVSLIVEENKEQPENISVNENIEAVYTARKIADMINSGFEVSLPEGRTRPCRPNDFCILVRSNRITKVYAEELEKLGIPAKGSEEKGYLRAREITVLIDLLRIISNPLLDVPMMAVMASPMYMFSVEDIAYIKSFDNERTIYSLMRDIAAGEIKNFERPDLEEHIVEFLSAVDAFRLDSVTMTIGELISSIYDTTDFISVMQLQADGEKKRANLRSLIQYAKGYEENSGLGGTGGLSGFLRHIDRIMESGDYEQGKITSDSGEHVTVQTLHGSKGLEYPFVFIAETGGKFRFDRYSVMCSDEGRIGYILYDRELFRRYKTFQQIMLCRKLEQSTRGEEMRLLYVGMTRAKQQLFVNLKCGEKQLERLQSLVDESCVNGSRDIINSAGSFSDWIWSALIQHKKFGEIAEDIEISTDTFGIKNYEYNDDVFDFCIYRKDREELTDFVQEKEEILPDERKVSYLRDIINAPYDRELAEMPAKLSVTQITKKQKQDEPFDFKLRKPRFMSGRSKLTGAERGTAIHTFFQYCSFENAIADTAAEITRMTELGYITEEQGKSINTANVRAFFNSSLYSRMVSAISFERERKFMAAASQLDIDIPVMKKLKQTDAMIKGIIDLIFEEEDGIVIVDYKSDRGVSAAKLKERYSMQMEFYRRAIELTSSKKVKELFLYSFELKKVIPIKIV